VDIVFSGHVHAYERSHPVFRNKRTSDGPTYVVIGDGGNREGIAKDYLQPPPVWSAFRRGRYGYGTFEVKNSTHAVFEWHEDDQQNAVVPDSFWLVRSRVMRQRGPLTAYGP
jgi:hypothetical protein